MDSQVISCIVKKAIKQEANAYGVAKMNEVLYAIQAVPQFGWGELEWVLEDGKCYFFVDGVEHYSIPYHRENGVRFFAVQYIRPQEYAALAEWATTPVVPNP
jgi:hypothetical protein